MPNIPVESSLRESLEEHLGRKEGLQDGGDVCYCTLWQLMWHMADHTKHPCLVGMESLTQRFPSLQDNWPPTESSVEIKAAVIRYALSLSLQTGTAVSDHKKTVRHGFQQNMKAWGDLWTRVCFVIGNHLGRGRLPAHLLPHPRPFAKLVSLSASADKLNEKDVRKAFAFYVGG